jgi:hypothetical protein
MAMFQNMEKEQNAYDYIQNSEQLPVGIRENAQSKLAGLYGVGPDQISAGSLIDEMGFGKYVGNAQNNPAVQKLIKSLLAGENRDADIGGLLANAGITDNPQARGVLERIQSGEFDTQSQGDIQQGMIDQARQSPLYGSLISGKNEAAERTAAYASKQGFNRSGNVLKGLYENDRDFETNALLQSYNQQLQGLGNMSQIGPIQSQLAGRLGPTTIPQGSSGGGGGMGFGLGDAMSMFGSFMGNSGGAGFGDVGI